MTNRLDKKYRTSCVGCGTRLQHDGRTWTSGGEFGTTCFASSHGEHSPRLPWPAVCQDCGESEGTIGERFLVPIIGGRWRHLRPDFCKHALELKRGREAKVRAR